jgi:hypothetical protein
MFASVYGLPVSNLCTGLTEARVVGDSLLTGTIHPSLGRVYRFKREPASPPPLNVRAAHSRPICIGCTCLGVLFNPPSERTVAWHCLCSACVHVDMVCHVGPTQVIAFGMDVVRLRKCCQALWRQCRRETIVSLHRLTGAPTKGNMKPRTTCSRSVSGPAAEAKPNASCSLPPCS